MSAEFRLLGDIEVRVNGRIVDAGHARQQCVLAVLLVEANRFVSADELIDRVWGERLPGDPGNTLQTYISLLRRVLAAAGDVRIARQHGGYKLTADAASIDAHRFGALVSQARGSDDAPAAALLEQALELWRGEPFARLDTPWINAVRSGLAVQRHAVQLDLTDAQLRLGEHAAILSGLSGQVAAEPLDERLAGQYMTALYRSGRQADALAHYQEIRRRLLDELATEPGPALRHLHQRMLRSDPELSVWPGSSRLAAPPRRPREVPRQLPVDVAGFTGRDRYLAELDLLLPPGSAEGGHPTAAVISAVSGTAGVGKTALAVHWAHQVGELFPDGQLYVNLRGYDPEGPVTAGEALGGFLRALGVPDEEVPADPSERAARFRSLLAGRRMLLLLDNASEAEQVRPLLPANPACLTLVTSRSSLSGLVARDGAVRLDLDLLPAAEAADLLRALIGPRADAEPGLLAALAEQCARLPLVLRIAAELVIARPAVPLADLVAELADEQRRLDLLEAGGDPRTGVRAVFSWSYHQLDSVTRRVFRLGGTHAGPGIDAYEVAALAGLPAPRATAELDRLVRVNLMYSAAPGRYSMHDLLRAYARELAAAADGEPERQEALARLHGYHLYAATQAMDALFPAENDLRPPAARPATPVPPLAGPGAARDWLDANRDSLIAVGLYAADHGWLAHAIALSATISRYLDRGGYYAEASALHARAVRAAHEEGDRAAEANGLNSLGLIDYYQGRYQEAVGRLQSALSLYRAAGDRSGEARSLSNLGIADFHLARYERSVGYLQQGLALYEELGNPAGAASVLGNLGAAEGCLGRYEPAIAHLHQALATHSEAGNKAGEAYALYNLGCVYRLQGNYELAIDYQQQALRLSYALGSRRGATYALADLADVCRLSGDHQQASAYHGQALEAFRLIGDRRGEAEALNGLGEASLAAGEPAGSRARHAEALAVASQISDKYGQARAHEGLGHAAHASGDPEQGDHHLREALALYSDIGAPEVGRLRGRLSVEAGRLLGFA
jgi:DNA-binding SARP family transcriptional activator